MQSSVTISDSRASCRAWPVQVPKRSTDVAAVTKIVVPITTERSQAANTCRFQNNDGRTDGENLRSYRCLPGTEKGEGKDEKEEDSPENQGDDEGSKDPAEGSARRAFYVRGDRFSHREIVPLISYEDGRLRAEMINFGVDPPESMQYVALWRPDRRTVKVAFGRSLLSGSDFGYYAWWALTFIEEGHELCGRSGGCTDSTAISATMPR